MQSQWRYLLTLLIVMPGTTYARDSVQWSLPDTPPAVIATGPMAGTGISELLMLEVQRRTPSINHLPHESVPTSRMIRAVKNGAEICRLGIVRTPERENDIVFSNALYYSMPHRLYVKYDEADPESLTSDGLNLDSFLSSISSISLVNERVYGNDIDSVLKNYSAKTEIVRSSFSSLAMVASGNAKSTIEFPGVFEFHVRNGAKLGALKSYRISGTKLIPVLVGCTKNAWGRRVIDTINQALSQENTLIGQTIYNSWISPSIAKELDQELAKLEHYNSNK